jgi:hypothetical protein
MTDMTQPDGTTTDAAQQAATQPDAAGDPTGGEQTDGAQTSATAPDATADATDRPGDIPFDQAAAEHENPALE